MTYLFGDLTARLAEKLGRLVPPILRLRDPVNHDTRPLVPGATVVFDDVFAHVVHDDGRVARIESIDGECFAIPTHAGYWAYASTIEVESEELRLHNPGAPRIAWPKVSRLQHSLFARLMDPGTRHAPPGALPGHARQR